MLRIITQQAEAYTELQRIRDRTDNGEIRATEATVRDIIEAVKHRGDRALLEASDLAESSPLMLQPLRVSGSELDAAYQKISKELLDAIKFACQSLEDFHRQSLPKSWVQFADDDIVRGKRYTPFFRAGLYLAGGKAAVSGVLMQAIPAQVAKVPQVSLVTPPTAERQIHPAILVAAQEAGVTEIYRLGGAAAIAALAYGTETITKVDVITGSGDLEVTLAKQIVAGTVALDTPISAADLMIIADEDADPLQITADLLAQAEQAPTAATILLTPDLSLAEAVQQAVQYHLQKSLPGILTEKAIAHYGLIILVNSLETAAELANQFAPQYLALDVAEPWVMVEQIRHADTIFLGKTTPKAIADYLGGSSLILAASGTTRYASAVGVETFMKSSSLIQYSPIALKQVANSLQILAQAEGLAASAEAIRLRNQSGTGDWGLG